jgi:hypothetical protein
VLLPIPLLLSSNQGFVLSFSSNALSSSRSHVCGVWCLFVIQQKVDSWAAGSDYAKVWGFLFMEHAIVLLKTAISHWVLNEPARIGAFVRRQEYLVDILLNGVDEEADPLDDPVVRDDTNDQVKKGGAAFKWDHVPLTLSTDAIALFNDSGYPDDEAPSPRATLSSLPLPTSSSSIEGFPNDNNTTTGDIATAAATSSPAGGPIGGAFVGEPASPNSSFHAPATSSRTIFDRDDRPLHSGTASDMYQE